MNQLEFDPAYSAGIRDLLEAPAPTASPAPPAGVSRRRVLTAVGVGLAAAAAGVVVLSGPRGGQSAAATDLLRRAADHASASSLARPGSVARIRRWSLDTFGAGNGLGPPEVVAKREVVTLLRVPVGDEPWRRKRWESLFAYAYGDRSKLPANMAVTDPTGRTGAAYETSTDGSFAWDSGTPIDPKELRLADSFAAIRALPLDPDALLQALEADGRGPGRGPGAGSAQQVLYSAMTVLGRGVANGSLQAAMFQALQKVPDLVILDDRATDIEGRTGVALGVRPGAPDPTHADWTPQLILDPATGQYFGSRAVSIRRNGLIPAGVQTDANAVRTDITTTAGDWTPIDGDRWNAYP